MRPDAVIAVGATGATVIAARDGAAVP